MAFDLAAVLRDVPKSDTSREQITYLPISSLVEDVNNFYGTEQVDNLADAIATVGLQQPIRVRPADAPDKYVVVSGHRRRKALLKLIDEGRTDLDPVPCIIEQQSGSAALEELRLIYGNSANRDLTAAEISRQAQRVQELLYSLKEEGYEFPGRMRDHVAEACNVSRSKLARLKVVREGLIPELLPLWDGDQLNEALAYELAKCNAETQTMIAQARANDLSNLYAWHIERIRQAVAAVGAAACPESGGGCTNAEAMRRRICAARPYTDLCDAKCCKRCSSRGSCESSCAFCASDRQAEAQKKAADKLAAQELAKKKKEEDTTRAAYHEAVCQRVDALMADRGVSSDELDKASKTMMYTYGKSSHNFLPIGNYLRIDDVRSLISAADKLGTSLDFLLRGSTPEEKPEALWRKGLPRTACQVVAFVHLVGVDDADDLLTKLRYSPEDGWLSCGHPMDPEIATVTYWAPMPEAKK